MMKRTLVILALVTAAAALAATVAGYQDWQLRGSTPGNPASGTYRTWADTTTARLLCITSAGAPCYFNPPPALTSQLYSGTLDPNGTAAEYAPHNMTSSSAPSPYVVSWNGGFTVSYNAFAGRSLATSPNLITMSGPACWVELDFGTPSTTTPILAYTVAEGFQASAARAPQAWTLQGSNDNSTWTTIDTRTSQVSWNPPSDARTYSTTATIPYRYIKMNITANNGDGSWTEFDELYLTSGPLGSNTSGVPGDFYINLPTKKIYGPKSGSSTWPLVGTLN
jgi:F5/8 type C domain-containing protein